MAAFMIPEEAENALCQADRALSALEYVCSALGETQLECRGDELAALFAMVRDRIHAARQMARFDARAG